MIKQIIGDPSLDFLFKSYGKYNDSIVLTDEDKKSNVKILCKEPYAQELYDKMRSFESSSGVQLHARKDLEVGEVYQVRARQISFDDRAIYAEELNSSMSVEIPFKEFTGSIDELSNGENLVFNVMIVKSDSSGLIVGSEKKCVSINHKTELMDAFDTNKWFEVKIKKLIKGGYIALYKDTLECFIPGSHAGANVIRDFSKLLGTTLNVMVDNYDRSNDLFILSYKKYVEHSMPKLISEIKFGTKYTGTLTNKPYKFGVFVEFDGYYTALIHSSEFKNYNEVSKTLKAGDTIDFYVKDVSRKGKQFRIVGTLNEENVDSEKKQWTNLRERTENETFDYDIDKTTNSIQIYIDGEAYQVSLRRKDLDRNLTDFPKVRIFKVDPINQNLKFEFVSEE
jgi:ribosomal protein S1